MYGNKKAYIVEIEQDKSWGPSTWIFVDSDSNRLYSCDDLKELIEYYIEQDLTYDDFSFYTLENKKLIFDRKPHKKGNVDDISIERWCEGVLKKVLHPKIMRKEA